MLNFDQAVALGLEELRRREEMMKDDLNRDQGEYNVIRNAIAHLESLEQREAETQERIAMQEEQKNTFELPHDYNQVFGDPRANDEIRLLVNMAIDKTTEYYESIIASKDEENLEALRDMREKYEETISNLERERDEAKKEKDQAEEEAQDLRNLVRELNDEKARLSEELTAIKEQLAQVTLEKQDAEAKRDAAAREIESLKAQIVELEQMAAANKKPKPEGLKISFTSTIQNDTPIKSAKELALERVGLGHLIKPKNMGGEPSGASFPGQTENRTADALVSTESDQSDQHDQEVTREEFRDSLSDLERGSDLVSESAARETSAGSDETLSAAALKARIESIEKRLEVIERHPNIRIIS